MNTTPKFSIGEVVILQSRMMPHHNGEYTVDRIIVKDEVFRCRLTGKMLKSAKLRSGFAYHLSNKAPDPELQTEVSWAETALRKKHIPGELSYSSLMQSLTTPVNA
jgi:hypothetical protein